MSLEQKKKDTIKSGIDNLIIALLLTIGTTGSGMDIGGATWSLAEAFRGGYKGGLLKLWNHFADIRGNMDYTLLPKYAGATASAGLFITLTASLIFVLSLLILRSGKRAPLLLYILPLLVLPFFVKRGPSPGHLLFVGAGLILALLKGRFRDQMSVWQFAAVGLLAGALFMVSGLSPLAGRIEKPTFAKKTNAWAAEKIHRLRFGENPLGSGDLSRTSRTSLPGAAMDIAMEKPETLYLRGYVGESYKQGRWENLAATQYYQKIPLTQALKAAHFDPMTQLAAVEKIVEPAGETGTIDIRVREASSFYLYHPYEIADLDGISHVKRWGDSFLTGEKIFGCREYGYEAVEGQTKKWTDMYGRLFTEEKAGNRRLDTYFLGESYNNVDLYGKYLALSSADVLALQPVLGEPGDYRQGHMPYREALQAITAYFRDNAVYTETGAPRGEREDFVKNFLASPRGFDTQFATVATLMFRYYGIPARYVEGYVITKDDVAHMQPNQPYELPLANAHAWPEIYIDGYGWVPVEVTEKFAAAVDQPDLEKGLENDQRLHPYEEPNKAEPPNKNGTEEEIASLGQTNVLFLLMLLLLALLALCYLLYKAIRALLVHIWWQKAFNQRDVNKGISALYAYMRRQKLSLPEQAIRLGNRAAYSRLLCTEGDRAYMKSVRKRLQRVKRREGLKKRLLGRPTHSAGTEEV